MFIGIWALLQMNYPNIGMCFPAECTTDDINGNFLLHFWWLTYILFRQLCLHDAGLQLFACTLLQHRRRALLHSRGQDSRKRPHKRLGSGNPDSLVVNCSPHVHRHPARAFCQSFPTNLLTCCHHNELQESEHGAGQVLLPCLEHLFPHVHQIGEWSFGQHEWDEVSSI